MSHIVKWLLSALITLLGISILFSIYSQFVLDYSLTRLEYAMSVAERAPDISSPLVRDVYKKLVHDMAIEETGRADSNIKNLVLMDAASMSLGEGVERAGYRRANIYLSSIYGSELTKRNKIIQLLDKLIVEFRAIYRKILSLLGYLQTKLFKRRPGPGMALEYSSILILTKAETAQKSGDLMRAAELYKRYLDFYPEQAESGFVMISLAYTQMRMGNLGTAEKLLKQVKRKYIGGEEAIIAHLLSERVANIRNRKKMIKDMVQLLQSADQEIIKNKLKMNLALAYLSIYEMDSAQELLEELSDVENAEISQKAQFYLGWLLKNSAQFEESIASFTALLNQSDIHPGIELGTRAELASLYYMKNESSKAMEFYREISSGVEKSLSSMEVASKTWDSLVETQRSLLYKGWTTISETEQASINFFDLGNPQNAEKNLAKLSALGSNDANVFELRKGLTQATELSLRDRGFDALRKGRIHTAYEMFQRNAELFPRDGWTMSGLATTYLLMADMEFAHKYAAQGYRFKADEYTASVLAYVKAFLGDSAASIGFYNEAVQRNSDYIPALFNLGCMYLEVQEYAKALKFFEELLVNLSDNKEYLRAKILNNIGYAYWHLGDPERAISRIQEAFDLVPDMLTVRDNIVQIKYRQEPAMIARKDG